MTSEQLDREISTVERCERILSMIDGIIKQLDGIHALAENAHKRIDLMIEQENNK